MKIQQVIFSHFKIFIIIFNKNIFKCLFVVQLITIKSVFFLIYFFQIITIKTTTIPNTHYQKIG